MFSDRLDIKLIGLVRDHPVLYDLNHPKYMDFNAREVAWQRIGDELKRPAGDCKVRWINIRDVNRRIIKKNLTYPRAIHRVYKYEAELAFMKPFYKDVVVPADYGAGDDKSQWDDAGDDNCDLPVDTDDSEKSTKKVAKVSKKSKKKKKWDFDEDEKPLSTINDAPSTSSDFDPADPVDAFLLSIGATLKTFSPYHLNLAKSKIFNVVQEHDLQQIVQKSSDVKSSDNIYME
ncbi:uncharacterized protein LOC135084316 [Ostrinia nubilalis]|uniref:uncharacterized protein LOC114361353 n=1 Tax=Ostrinia furnacalis TaxID=93504 RepID=UPI001038C650|nr:uncharacterized protein LOC114361353 [Ostrinia furnacalis]